MSRKKVTTNKRKPAQAKPTNEPAVQETGSLEKTEAEASDTQTIEGGQVQEGIAGGVIETIDTPSREPSPVDPEWAKTLASKHSPQVFPGAAVAVVIAAQHFGTGDALSSMPTTLPDELGVSWHAYKENDGTVTLLREASRHVYDSNRAMLSGAKEAYQSAHRHWSSAKQHLEQNKDAVGDMPDKLRANVVKFKAEVDKAQERIDECYSNCPALLREKLTTEAELLMSKVKDLQKKAEKLRKSAAEWRAKGADFLPQEAIDAGASPNDRNEVRAQQVEAEAEKIEAEISEKRSTAELNLQEASIYPEGPAETKYVLRPGELIGVSV